MKGLMDRLCGLHDSAGNPPTLYNLHGQMPLGVLCYEPAMAPDEV